METTGPVSSATASDAIDPTPTVAAFDVDKTLTVRDCVVPFLWRLTGWRTVPRLLRWSLPVGWAVIRRDRDRVKALATRIILTGLERRIIEAHAAAHAVTIRESWLRPDVCGRLRWHRTQGHHVVLVSASFTAYLHHVARALECTEVLACEIEYDDSDRCTGRLVAGNCRGAEKERRLRRWMEASGLGSASIYAYGDSQGDAHLLAMADWPTRITREPIHLVPGHIVLTTGASSTS